MTERPTMWTFARDVAITVIAALATAYAICWLLGVA